MEYEKLDPHCEEVANTFDIYGSLKPEPYYDFLSKKMQIPENYDDLIRFFICKRIFPIICNELNHAKYNSYRMWPMPYMNGPDKVVCLANNETALTKDAFKKADFFADNLFHPMCSIPDRLDEIYGVSWPYLVLYKKIQTDNKHPKYQMIARTNYVVTSDGNYKLTFSEEAQSQFQPCVEQFEKDCVRLSQEILTDFKNTPVMLGIKEYNGSINDFENEILPDIDQELRNQGFSTYHAYFDNSVPDATIIRVCEQQSDLFDENLNIKKHSLDKAKKKNQSYNDMIDHPELFFDDSFHIINYSLDKAKKKNRFYYDMIGHHELHFRKINVGKIFFDVLKLHANSKRKLN